MTRDWQKLEASGGLTREQRFLMTALWREVHGEPPLFDTRIPENRAFAKENPERYKILKKVWKNQRRKHK